MTKAALDALHPAGYPRANNPQAIRLGTAAGPGGLRVTSLPGADPYTLAQSIDDYRSRVAGRPSDAVIVDRRPTGPSSPCPPRRVRGESTDSVLFTARDTLHAPTRAAIRAHGRPHIYVLGPVSAVSAAIEAQLAQLGTVTRIAAADAPSTAFAFAPIPGRELRLGRRRPGPRVRLRLPEATGRCRRGGPAVSERHLRAAAPDRARGVTSHARSRNICSTSSRATPVTRCAVVYNHGLIVGDTRTVGVAAQATIDGLLEIAPVPAKKP